VNIPKNGMTKGDILATLESYKADDIDWRSGRAWAYVYDPGPEAEEVIKGAFNLFMSENALDFTAFPSMRRLEQEVVRMAANHLSGSAEVVGNFTSGGTESIILAVKTARDWARATRPEITRPEIVLPITAHAAFHKACHYLDVEKVLVPVDETTFAADVEATRAAITPNTVMLVGSAISYAHGVVDPIPELAALAAERGLLMHVDGCMGGFMLPYFKRLGCEIPDFDFAVPGVTSISMDLHKYAFAAKGASVVLYRDKALREHQIYACANWTGYTIVNPTVQSTKSGGPLAGAWAALHFIGDDGYLEMARQALEGTRRIAAAVEANPDLRLLGRPDMNLIAFTSDTVNVFEVIDDLNARGWFVHPQLGYRSSKENIHISVNPACVKWIDELIADLDEVVAAVRARGAAKGGEDPTIAALKQALGQMDTSRIDPALFGQMLAMAGIQGAELPERMAEINDLLNALPVNLKEALLKTFVNDLFR
jgi:sphinganine-1-phosphate aldolase